MSPEEVSRMVMDQLEAYMRELLEQSSVEQYWATQCPRCLTWYVLGTQHQCETKLLGPGLPGD